VRPVADFVRRREGDWRLWVRPQVWSERLWEEVRGRAEERPPARHPRIEVLPGGYYLKLFFPKGVTSSLKDLWRASPARRAARQSVALERLGFCVPTALAAGEKRRCRHLERAFLLTPAVAGEPLARALSERARTPLDREALREKREALRELAREVRRMHDLGFVHGDLVPTNILARREGTAWRFCYLDHDRTRRYPRWWPRKLWRRNLVQLNRFALPGISLQDRLRFARAYLGGGRFRRAERRLLAWLERKTRARRWECDRVNAPVSFRELMRWDGPYQNIPS
jgi:hypothetical protein